MEITPIKEQYLTMLAILTAIAASVAAIVAVLAGPVGDERPTRTVDHVVATTENTLPAEAAGRKVESSGKMRDLVTPEHRADFDAYMSVPENRTEFVKAFQEGIKIGMAGTSDKKANASGLQNVLAFGWDRDHAWMTASYADMVRGAIWGAVRWCQSRVPGYLCSAAGNWLSSMANGWGSSGSHGVWAAVYWNRYTGGRW